MKKRFIIQLSILSIFSLFFGCATKVYQTKSIEYNTYRINKTDIPKNEITKLLTPYADSVNNSMNGIIGSFDMEMNKAQPESNLGNFMADAFLVMARKKYNTNVDIAFMNSGGIRLNTISPGNITTGKIFELMPFDNILLLLKIKGAILKELFDHISNRGGWPIAGATHNIMNKKAENILINGKALNLNEIYTITISDYVANGGDDCIMLKGIPQINNGYLQRDALLEYVKIQTANGKKVIANVEGRVKKL